MTSPDKAIHYRMGEEKDVSAIADYLNMAGHGYLEALENNKLIEGSWRDFISKAIQSPGSIKFFGNTCIAECDGKVVGIVSGYVQPPIPPANQLQTAFTYERNLLELRRNVIGSFYIANVAVDPDFRGQGIARHFIDLSFNVAAQQKCKEIFGIIHESNTDWLDSFLRRGFSERKRALVADYPSLPLGSEWILVTRLLEEI
jgi:ribosomal protein S18 acetylase RimI-like enzyme